MSLSNKDLFGQLFETEADADFSNLETEKAWKQLLDILNNESDNDYLKHYFIRQDDFNDNFKSILGQIQSDADLKDGRNTAHSPDAFDALLTALEAKTFNDSTNNGLASGQTGSLWNESVNKAIVHYLKYIKVIDSSIAIPGTGGYITYDDVWDADAGFSFSSFKTAKWVKPWLNIDGQSYEVVRSNDYIINGVLDSNNNLQFTHKNTADEPNWIRLLMPMYKRFVEIEDLDRNFWVIGQVISGICGYLFDKDGPISKGFRNLLREIGELWENILFLWAALALMNKRVYTDVHVEVVYLPNDANWEQFKYDDFKTNGISWTEICNRLAYKIQEYSESNLILIPVKRNTNYYHNYYSTEQYPGILFYDRTNPFNKNNGFRILSFQELNEQGAYSETGNITTSLFKDSIYAARDNGDGTLTTIFPYRDVEDTKDTEENIYYSAIRVKVDFPTSSWSYDGNNGFTFKKISFKCYDAIGQAIKNEEIYLGELKLDKEIKINEVVNQEPQLSNSNSRIREPLTLGTEEITNTLGKEEHEIKQGYYLGELASGKATSSEISYEIDSVQLKMPPLYSTRLIVEDSSTGEKLAEAGRFLTEDFFNGNVLTPIGTNIQDDNQKILKQIKNTFSLAGDKIRLYTAYSAFNLYKPEYSSIGSQLLELRTGTVGLGKYFDINNNSLRQRSSLKSNNLTLQSETDTAKENLLQNLQRIDSGLDASEIWDFGTISDPSDNKITLNNNPYLLPLSYYRKINLTSSEISRGRVRANLYDDSNLEDTVKSKSYVEDFIKAAYGNGNPTEAGIDFTSTHGGLLELGAILTAPFLSEPQTYNSFFNYRVIPEITHYWNWQERDSTNFNSPPSNPSEKVNNTSGYVYGVYLGGESLGNTRHTWNSNTTITLQQGNKLKDNNWMIIYIQTYGIYGTWNLDDSKYINTDFVIENEEGNTNTIYYCSDGAGNINNLYGYVLLSEGKDDARLKGRVWDSYRVPCYTDSSMTSKQGNIYTFKQIQEEIHPVVFKTTVHVFMPDSKYVNITHNGIEISEDTINKIEKYSLLNSMVTTITNPNNIDTSTIETILNTLDPRSISEEWGTTGIGTTGYKLIGWTSSSNGYKYANAKRPESARGNYSDSDTRGNLYNFYKYKRKGK